MSDMRELAVAARDERVRLRYYAKVKRFEDDECWWWCGAIAGKGHGRFWVARDWVVIAHRLGWAIAHPDEPVPELIGHECDNPLCQRPDHLAASDRFRNRAEWAARRHRPGSPLRDIRGSHGRARAIRDALVMGQTPHQIAAQGLSPVDRDQLPLW